MLLKDGYLPTRPPFENITLDIVKDECEKRIKIVVSLEAQSNINRKYVEALVKSVKTEEDLALISAVEELTTWVDAMRANCPGLVDSPTYTTDTEWPEVPPSVIFLGEAN